ncbi:MAG: hypothetical protein DWH99_01215 [Planctomycetota bacterium]|nr:MAG: hypothetical protein DWH99_01215 [Planctomycetota bacterium]
MVYHQRSASLQFKQPSSTTKSDARHEQSFNPQPTARKSLFCTHVVLRIATIRTRWDLISTNVVSILIEEGIRHGCLDSITITSTVRRGGLSTSTTKSDARHEQSFNPQPTARKSLFCTYLVLRIATIRTRWDLISTNVVSILIEEGVRHGCLDSITISSTFRHGGLSTSTTKSDKRHDQLG